MTPGTDRLWQLLPLVHRQRDEQLGGPLRALLRVITEQADGLEDAIAALHDNSFIETCEEWAVPYIGELIGWRPAIAAPPGRLPPGVVAPRREVANTIGWRRRKGTLALLAELARDVAGWPARVIEFGPMVTAAARIDVAAAPLVPATLDLRHGAWLTRLNSAFASATRTPELRRAGSHRGRGRYGLHAVVVFAARMQALAVTRADANCIEERGRHCFTFSPLGQDAPLYACSQAGDAAAVGDEATLPVPIRRRALQDRATGEGPGISALYYGAGRSFAVWAYGWDGADDGMLAPDRFVVADLAGWRYRPRPGTVAIDPVRGRLAFPPNHPPRRVQASFHHGFSAALGGGEYHRPAPLPDAVPVFRVGGTGHEGHHHLRAALQEWREQCPPCAVIEFQASQTYDEDRVMVELAAGQELTIRAAAGTRPLLRLLDWQVGRDDAMRVSGAPGSRLVLEGLMISGRGLRIAGPMGTLELRHCTLVPGWDLYRDGRPRHPGGPSLVLEAGCAEVRASHCILGPILVAQDEVAEDPVAIVLADCILDAGNAPTERPAARGGDPDAPDADEARSGGTDAAIGAPGALVAPVVLTLRRCTVFGRIAVHAMALAEDSILSGPVLAARRQVGCLRHCYVRPGSRTPTRHACQPDLAALGLRGTARLEAQRAVAPVWDSIRYGTPAYARLAASCADAVRRGAGDEAEMGAMHDLYWPQREDALRTRIAEFVPAATDAGLVFIE